MSNSNAGRPKKPTQQKILEGSRVRDDRDADAMIANASVPLGMPPCPPWLANKKGARKHWDTLGPKLVEVGLLSVVDGDVFALHCENIDAYQQVLEKLEEIESWVSVTPNKFEVQSVWLQIRNSLQDRIVKLAKEFGLTPASRSSVKVDKQAQLSLLGAEVNTNKDNDPYLDYGLRS